MQSEASVAREPSLPASVTATTAWPPSFLRLILAAILTVGLGFMIIKLLYPIFVVPEEIVNFPEQSPRWMYERLDKAKSQVAGKNYSVVFGTIGAILGASCVAFCFGVRATKSLLIAVLASAALGILGANLSNWMFDNLRESNGKELKIMGVAIDSMKQIIIGYALLWSSIGLGVGIGVGSIRGFSKALIAGISGLLGGMLGAMIYVMLTAQFFVSTTMNQVLPFGDTNQAIWLTLFTLVIAACIAAGTGEKRQTKPT